MFFGARSAQSFCRNQHRVIFMVEVLAACDDDGWYVMASQVVMR